MPLLPHQKFSVPAWMMNGHWETVWPSLFRKIPFRYSTRERLELPDGDFVDVDWKFASTDTDRLVIITHGLEGDSHRHYVTGMAKIFTAAGYDALGWNCRSCSGEMNRLLRFYHHGDADDLRRVIEYALEKRQYQSVTLIGFSMGGSLTLRALAEDPSWVPPVIHRAVAFSVPCDLHSGVLQLMKPGNQFYTKRFLRKLGKKIRIKEQKFPGEISSQNYHQIQHFIDFDNRYTAPLHGYRDAFDFYQQASVKPLLPNLRVPSLLVQAANDPFLAPECFCEEVAKDHPYLYLEITDRGGHCGFQQKNAPYSWAEERALHFVLNDLPA